MDEPKRPTGGSHGGNVKVYEKAAVSNVIAVMAMIAIILVGLVLVVNFVLSQAG